MTTEVPLTKRQRQIADFLTSYTEEHRCAPSIREIAEHLGLSSPATVHRHLQHLRDKGVIQHHARRRRGLLLTPRSEGGLIELPLVGVVSGGYPLELFAHSQKFSVAHSLVPDVDHCYLLQAQGDTMHDVLIADGDLLVVHARRWADEGEMVLGILETGEVTIKKFFWEKGQIRLEGATPSTSQIVIDADTLTIHGVVVALVRSL